MLAATLAGRGANGRRYGSLRDWQVAGCIGSAAMLAALACAGAFGAAWPLRANVFALGVANGAFSIAAIASMMRLASLGAPARVGLRMGLWGAAQAVAFGFGGLFGTACSDLARWVVGSPGSAYAAVFAVQALLFVASAVLAVQLGRATARAAAPQPRVPPGAAARLAIESR
jgi:BCD family chlorophyll transporter-like MFS transporter